MNLNKLFLNHCKKNNLEVNPNQIILRGGYWETTQKGKFWRKPGYIGFRSANAHHRVDLKEGTKPMTIFIPGPFGLRKGSRSEYGIDFKTKK